MIVALITISALFTAAARASLFSRCSTVTLHSGQRAASFSFVDSALA